jgi:molecular chaperone DnaJ
VREHPQLLRRGTELFYELPVTFPQAALGATLEIPTVEGTEPMEIPAGTQSGTELRLHGRGVPRLRGAGRGDLHVIVTVVVPPKPSKRERELLQELRDVGAPAVLPKGGPGLVDRLRDLFS